MTAWFIGSFLALFYLDRISRDPQDSFRLACLAVRDRVSRGPLITPFCPHCHLGQGGPSLGYQIGALCLRFLSLTQKYKIGSLSLGCT